MKLWSLNGVWCTLGTVVLAFELQDLVFELAVCVRWTVGKEDCVVFVFEEVLKRQAGVGRLL